MQPAPKKTSRWLAAKRTLTTAFLAVAGTMGCESQERPRPPDMAYSTFVQELENERIQKVVIDGQMIVAAKQNFFPSNLPPNTEGPPLVTYMPANEDLSYLRKSKAQVDIMPPEPPARIPWMTLGMTFLAFSVGSIFLQYHLQKKLMTGAGGKAGEMGKARAREIKGEDQKVRFSDVAGIDEVKTDLQEIVGFLKDPKQFQQLGAKVPRGVLLSGPPGTGKTLIAKALAGEAGVPFFETSGSEFVEMFVGVGAARVRSLFEQAKKKAPSIVFIDEIDAVGRHRGAGVGGGNDEREQTLNQILTEMQGFDSNSGVIVIAATNRPDVLDGALMRPGRFDRKIAVGRPDLNGREKILGVHTRKKPLAEDVDLRKIARGIPGFAGADIENLVNEAALLAGRYKADKISAMHFSQAKDKILMGTERKLLISNAELDNTAHHEAGHAIVSLFTPGNDPIEKASIIPRDRTLGVVVTMPEKDEYSVTVRKMKSKLAVLAAGRIAEELFTGDKDLVTGGAQNDISVMTDIATQMVRTLGMSDLGMRGYGEDKFGRALFASASKQEKIDAAIDGLVREAMDTARKVLAEHDKEWRGLARALRQHETIDGDDIRALVLEGKEINPVKYPPPPPPSSPENPAPALKREWKPWK